MSLSPPQNELLALIESAIRLNKTTTITYVSEWLGYLPFGVYHWIECDGQDISRDFILQWDRGDMVALESSGMLSKMTEWTNPADEYEVKVTYKVNVLRSLLEPPG
jgi:hypothetical protein